MTSVLPQVYLVRDGETVWSLTGQHTGRTDIPLTPQGEINARKLGEHLSGVPFSSVFTSPLQRAVSTCELAGFGTVMEKNANLVEWDYGEYEGRRSAEILLECPTWDLFRDGCPGGESIEQIGRRADAVVTMLRGIEGNVLVFSSGHILRVLAARWLGLVPGMARFFVLSTASLSILGYEHIRQRPAIRLWNESHVSDK